jgi:hypothetical protein
MRTTAPFVLLMLTACRPATNVRVATESPAGAKSSAHANAEAPAGAELSPALVEIAEAWHAGSSEAPQPELVRGWHPHAGSGTCFPVGYADFTLGKTTEYGPDDESLSLVSEARGTTVSLYVYPAKHEFEAEFASVKGSMDKTCGPGVGGSMRVADDRFSDGGMVGLCTHMLGDIELVEQVVLFSRDGWYYKARTTWPAFLNETSFTATRQIIATAFNTCEAPG